VYKLPHLMWSRMNRNTIFTCVVEIEALGL
jgi:hypothetical protein